MRPEVRAQVLKTYAYSAAALGLTGASAAASFALPAMAAGSAAWAMRLGMGVLLTSYLARSTVLLPQAHKLLKHGVWAAFAVSAGYGLSITASAGLAVLAPTLLAALTLFSGMVYYAMRPSLGEVNAQAGRANVAAALQGLTVGGALVRFMGPQSGGKQLQYILGGFNLFLGWEFSVQHMQRLQQEATKDPDYDPIAQSVTLYVNLLGIFWSLGAFVLPPPGSPTPSVNPVTTAAAQRVTRRAPLVLA